MYTSTSICNMALAYLGQAPISSLKQDNERARLLQLFYAPVRDEVLRAHNWAFATVEKPLVRVVTQARKTGRFFYKYPADALFIRRVSSPAHTQQPLPFTQEYDAHTHQRMLVTSAAQAVATYIRRVTDESQFDATFAKTFALALASDAALALTGDVTLAARLQQQYQIYIEQARQTNLSEQHTLASQTDAFSEVR